MQIVECQGLQSLGFVQSDTTLVPQWSRREEDLRDPFSGNRVETVEDLLSVAVRDRVPGKKVSRHSPT